MNKLINNPLGMLALSTAASLNKIPKMNNLSLLNLPKNYGIKQNLRNRNNGIFTQNGRRPRKRKNNNGIEINKAEGGFKNITIPYRTQGIGINTYGRIVVTKVGESWIYGFQPENDNFATHGEYNIMTMLNDSIEFKNRLKTTSQYKVIGIRICIMNERIPEAKDRLSRLLVHVNTTKVSVLDPKVQNNVMRLNMNTIGTKNFNFNLNNANIGKDFTGWYDGEDLYTGNVYLHVTQEDINNITDETETTIILGTVKITFSILTRIQDYTRNNEPSKKLTDKEKIEKLEKQIEEMKNKDKK
jgi:hypothetical protein